MLVLVVLGIGVGCLAGIGIGTAGSSSTTSSPSPSPVVVYVTVPAGGKPEPAAPTTAAKPPPPAPAAPAGITQDGTLVVGVDIKPGTYRATVPADSFGCYWARLRGTSGSLNDIIANGVGNAGEKMIVTVMPSDKALKVAGCGPWTRA